MKFLIFSGKISFPLILFHMPIIYFLNLIIINKLAVVILTFLLSYFFSILIFKIKIKLTSVKFDRYKKYTRIFNTSIEYSFVHALHK